MNKKEYMANIERQEEFEGLANALAAYMKIAMVKDPHLAANYRDDMIDECADFVGQCAARYLDHKNGGVPDALVFKWCRDYFLDEIYKEDEKSKDNQNEAKAEPKKESPKASYIATVDKQDVTAARAEQLDLFGGL